MKSLTDIALQRWQSRIQPDLWNQRAARILEGHCGWDEGRDHPHGALIPDGDFGRCPSSGYLFRVVGESGKAYIEIVAGDKWVGGSREKPTRIEVQL